MHCCGYRVVCACQAFPAVLTASGEVPPVPTWARIFAGDASGGIRRARATLTCATFPLTGPSGRRRANQLHPRRRRDQHHEQLAHQRISPLDLGNFWAAGCTNRAHHRSGTRRRGTRGRHTHTLQRHPLRRSRLPGISGHPLNSAKTRPVSRYDRDADPGASSFSTAPSACYSYPSPCCWRSCTEAAQGTTSGRLAQPGRGRIDR